MQPCLLPCSIGGYAVSMEFATHLLTWLLLLVEGQPDVKPKPTWFVDGFAKAISWDPATWSANPPP